MGFGVCEGTLFYTHAHTQPPQGPSLIPKAILTGPRRSQSRQAWLEQPAFEDPREAETKENQIKIRFFIKYVINSRTGQALCSALKSRGDPGRPSRACCHQLTCRGGDGMGGREK